MKALGIAEEARAFRGGGWQRRADRYGETKVLQSVARSPSKPEPITTGMTPILNRNSATAAAIPMSADGHLGEPAQPLRPQDVIGEEDRQVGDDADHRRGDARQRRGELELAVGRLDERAPEQG